MNETAETPAAPPRLTSIPMVPAPPKLLSSYGTGGKTRDSAGQIWSVPKLILVGDLCRRNPEAWSCPPGMARDLDKLNEAMRAEGSAGIRITELGRSWTVGAQERAKYDRWVAAGKPERGSRLFDPSTMRTAFIKPPGEGHHFWSGAFDFDVEALDFPKVPRAEQLHALWEIAAPLGFTPIIAHPDAGQSESWHLDHLGGLQAVHRLALDAGSRRAYEVTAMVGCILTGRFVGSNKMERLVQARLLAGGWWCGEPDGAIGPATVAACVRAGIDDAKRTTPAAHLLAALDKLEIGCATIEAV